MALKGRGIAKGKEQSVTSDSTANSIGESPPPGQAARPWAPQSRSTAASCSYQPLGATLEPVLREACQGRLSQVNWFRTDWQRGGALTGYATYRDEHHREHRAVVKLPVPPAERHWLVALQEHDHVVPDVYAHGTQLNGYDLAWVVMEYLPHGPLSAAWQGREFDLLVEAIGRFYAATRAYPPVGKPDQRDWQQLVDKTRKHLQSVGQPNAQRWRKALKKSKGKFKKSLAIWRQRPLEDWCHGDLHLANAMTRTPAPQGPAVLLDLARVRPGHWTEDAVYLEHLYWGYKDRLGGRRLSKQIAEQRKALNLPVDPDWARLAQIKRQFLAMTAPLRVGDQAGPQQLDAALQIVESGI